MTNIEYRTHIHTRNVKRVKIVDLQMKAYKDDQDWMDRSGKHIF